MFEAPVSCKPRPRFGNGLLRDAWGVWHHAVSSASKMTLPSAFVLRLTPCALRLTVEEFPSQLLSCVGIENDHVLCYFLT
jgi:hypothetical protein